MTTTNTLPYDYARCHGAHNHPQCADCRRKEPGHPERQSYLMPAIVDNKCTTYIPPEGKK